MLCVDGCRYYNGHDFKDFAAIDWEKEGIDKANTLVFMDDHQVLYGMVQCAARCARVCVARM